MALPSWQKRSSSITRSGSVKSSTVGCRYRSLILRLISSFFDVITVLPQSVRTIGFTSGFASAFRLYIAFFADYTQSSNNCLSQFMCCRSFSLLTCRKEAVSPTARQADRFCLLATILTLSVFCLARFSSAILPMGMVERGGGRGSSWKSICWLCSLEGCFCCSIIHSASRFLCFLRVLRSCSWSSQFSRSWSLYLRRSSSYCSSLALSLSQSSRASSRKMTICFSSWPMRSLLLSIFSWFLDFSFSSSSSLRTRSMWFLQAVKNSASLRVTTSPTRSSRDSTISCRRAYCSMTRPKPCGWVTKVGLRYSSSRFIQLRCQMHHCRSVQACLNCWSHCSLSRRSSHLDSSSLPRVTSRPSLSLSTGTRLPKLMRVRTSMVTEPRLAGPSLASPAQSLATFSRISPTRSGELARGERKRQQAESRNWTWSCFLSSLAQYFVHSEARFSQLSADMHRSWHRLAIISSRLSRFDSLSVSSSVYISSTSFSRSDVNSSSAPSESRRFIVSARLRYSLSDSCGLTFCNVPTISLICSRTARPSADPSFLLTSLCSRQYTACRVCSCFWALLFMNQRRKMPASYSLSPVFYPPRQKTNLATACCSFWIQAGRVQGEYSPSSRLRRKGISWLTRCGVLRGESSLLMALQMLMATSLLREGSSRVMSRGNCPMARTCRGMDSRGQLSTRTSSFWVSALVVGMALQALMTFSRMSSMQSLRSGQVLSVNCQKEHSRLRIASWSSSPDFTRWSTRLCSFSNTLLAASSRMRSSSLRANCESRLSRFLRMPLTSTPGSRLPASERTRIYRVSMWNSSGKDWIMQSRRKFCEISSLQLSTSSSSGGSTAPLQTSSETPSSELSRRMFSPTRMRRSLRSFSSLSLSLPACSRIQSRLVSCRLARMMAMASRTVRLSVSYSLPLSGSLSLQVFRKQYRAKMPLSGFCTVFNISMRSSRTFSEPGSWDWMQTLPTVTSRQSRGTREVACCTDSYRSTILRPRRYSSLKQPSSSFSSSKIFMNSSQQLLGVSWDDFSSESIALLCLSPSRSEAFSSARRMKKACSFTTFLASSSSFSWSSSINQFRPVACINRIIGVNQNRSFLKKQRMWPVFSLASGRLRYLSCSTFQTARFSSFAFLRSLWASSMASSFRMSLKSNSRTLYLVGMKCEWLMCFTNTPILVLRSMVFALMRRVTFLPACLSPTRRAWGNLRALVPSSQFLRTRAFLPANLPLSMTTTRPCLQLVINNTSSSYYLC